MSSRDASSALRRFGLGPRPGEIKQIAGDPRGFVLAQLTKAASVRMVDTDLLASHDALAALREAQLAQRLAREFVKDGTKPASTAPGLAGAPQRMADAATSAGPVAGTAVADPATGPAKAGAIRRETYADEMVARIRHATTTHAAFIERLVMFWSSHFCVSAAKGPVRVLAGAYEREVIRPHVLGRFGDMLKASAQHPAMLIYLDNAQSIGPNSKAGQNRGKGLNENLARELLELHTLGVNGGYTQDDVTNLARLLTGWTVATAESPKAEAGRFIFTPNRHEPGAWTVAGKRYEARGQAAGEACLADLARAPATARHIAMKLARHFVSEKPPAALVATLERTFRESDGDLAALARTLAASDETWSEPARKVVPPYDFAVSLVRGFELKVPHGEVARLASALGQPLWQPPSPRGWPEDDNAWMGPSAVRERLRIAERIARDIDKLADPRMVSENLLGPALSAATRQAVARAETREQGFELTIMSPEFLRR